ncbi:C3a anaphylatoxin chemotactic receptor [Pantherophis guttatus]|uniref:C3a anaphylatoxin chemotactic receptor n=1 Tax=Pantherophis guttatus TaxID=94885 RepID=A0A6P9D9S2_PANGU|nr:C3a anaphylatoxin chemotactic receptor [Pantherophis guttatus]
MAPLLANGSLDENSEPFPLPSTSVGSLAIFSITFLLGFPGNGLVIWAIALKMKRTVNTVWFLHLAIADFVCCLSLPFSIGQLALHERWPFGRLLCKVLPSAVIFNMFASVFLLTAISIDRCLLVTKPVWCQNHRTVRLASAVCGVIWILAFLLCCPSFFYRETLKDEFGNTRCMNNWQTERHEDYQWLDDLWDVEDPTLLATESTYDRASPGGNLDPHPSYPTVNTTQRITVTPLGVSHHSRTKTEADFMRRPVTVAPSILHEFPGVHPSLPTASTSQFKDQPADYFPDAQPPSVFVSITLTRAVLGFLLPFAVMAACYALIARKMLSKLFVGPRRRALQLILLVVATFFLCWAPFHVTGLLFLLAAPQTSLHQALLWWDSVSVALAYANSCINPLLYVFVGQHFRRKVCQTVQEMFEGAFAEPSSAVCSRDKRQTTTVDEVDVSVSVL